MERLDDHAPHAGNLIAVLIAFFSIAVIVAAIALGLYIAS